MATKIIRKHQMTEIEVTLSSKGNLNITARLNAKGLAMGGSKAAQGAGINLTKADAKKLASALLDYIDS